MTGRAGPARAVERCLTVRQSILQAAAKLQSASTSIETSFLEVGRRLSGSIEVLERLSVRFGSLQAELESPEMQGATQRLARVAAQIAELDDARQGESQALGDLTGIAAGLRRRINEILREVRTIDVLAINARIIAAGLGAAGTDFVDYIGEVAEPLDLARTNLQRFQDDLKEAQDHLHSAGRSETAFGQRYAQTIATIPRQLADDIAMIASRRQIALAAAAEVAVKSRQLGNDVGKAIAALQVGDATRQRLEHASHLAALITRALDPAGDARLEAPDEPWSDLSEDERVALAAAGCALQAAQLTDMASEFGHNGDTAQASLQALTQKAGDILRGGSVVYGADGSGDAPFMAELEQDVGEAQALFAGFRAARERADQALGSVLEIAKRLATHIRTVRDVETDIRIMGVNATLKCDRLGSIGRSLNAIAYEVTASSGRTASQAGAANADVDRILAAANSVAGAASAEKMEKIAAVTNAMTASIEALRAVAGNFTLAFDALTRDCGEVSNLLSETAASLKAVRDIDGEIRAAAAEFAALARDAAPAPKEARRKLFELVARDYTMAREREVQARIAPETITSIAPPAPQAELDDILF